MTVRRMHADIACADHSSTQQQSCGSAPEGEVRAVATNKAHIEIKQSVLLILTTSTACKHLKPALGQRTQAGPRKVWLRTPADPRDRFISAVMQPFWGEGQSSCKKYLHGVWQHTQHARSPIQASRATVQYILGNRAGLFMKNVYAVNILWEDHLFSNGCRTQVQTDQSPW